MLQHERDPEKRREEERAVGPSCINFYFVEKEIRAMLSAEQCCHHLNFPKTEKVKCEMDLFNFFFLEKNKERKTTV